MNARLQSAAEKWGVQTHAWVPDAPYRKGNDTESLLPRPESDIALEILAKLPKEPHGSMPRRYLQWYGSSKYPTDWKWDAGGDQYGYATFLEAICELAERLEPGHTTGKEG